MGCRACWTWWVTYGCFDHGIFSKPWSYDWDHLGSFGMQKFHAHMVKSRATPVHHPFSRWDFPSKKPRIFGYPHDYGAPHLTPWPRYMKSYASMGQSLLEFLQEMKAQDGRLVRLTNPLILGNGKTMGQSMVSRYFLSQWGCVPKILSEFSQWLIKDCKWSTIWSMVKSC